MTNKNREYKQIIFSRVNSFRPIAKFKYCKSTKNIIYKERLNPGLKSYENELQLHVVKRDANSLIYGKMKIVSTIISTHYIYKEPGSISKYQNSLY